MTNTKYKLRVSVLGGRKVGKTAITVRYLTKRFIGEYSSSSDFVYKQTVKFANFLSTEVEILDLLDSQAIPYLFSDPHWADAVLVVYSICDRSSFVEARTLLERISGVGSSQWVALILLGNKRDLHHRREVQVDEGHELSLRNGCQFYEVSAADSSVGVSLAFQSVLREARALQLLRRKIHGGGAATVSRMIGIVFGKAKFVCTEKKRPSLTI